MNFSYFYVNSLNIVIPKFFSSQIKIDGKIPETKKENSSALLSFFSFCFFQIDWLISGYPIHNLKENKKINTIAILDFGFLKRNKNRIKKKEIFTCKVNII
jgi:hypothetical protein